MTPLINILTRTSGRPNAFARCSRSVDSQTYNNINHIVGVDNEADINYVKALNKEPVLIDRQSLINNDESLPFEDVCRYLPHNLYINILHSHVKDGWIMYLDDDDYLISPDVIQKIVDQIVQQDVDTLFIWQMAFEGGYCLPPMIPENIQVLPIKGQIGSPCFAFNVKYLEHAKWDGWDCSDFRVVTKLNKAIWHTFCISEPYVFIEAFGFGYRQDIDKSSLAP